MTVPAQAQAGPGELGQSLNDEYAEQCVLGGMLLSADAIADVIPLAKPEQFSARHETIYQAILDVYGQGRPADPITVAAELTKRGEIAKVGGASYLHDLVQVVPTAANAEHYAVIVHEKAVLRELNKAGRTIAAITQAQEGELADICNRAQSLVYAATEVSTIQEGDIPVGDVLEDMLDEIEARAKRNKGEVGGLETGLRDLDALTDGLQPGQMIVIAARPAMGKSTLALDFARCCSIKHSLPSQIFSLEMGRNELTMRMMSAEARVALHHMRTGTTTDEDWTRLARRMPEVSAAPLFIDDSPNITLNYIRSRARKRKAESGLALIVVDYIQLMESGGRVENRQQEVSKISRGLKMLAKELEVPVIALSQLNRGPEQRQDKKPLISDLRESGAIEQDADIVILLHREDAYEKETPRAGETDLIVAKHRNGPTATVTVASQLHFSRFVDMAQT